MTQLTADEQTKKLFLELKEKPDFPTDKISKKVLILSTQRCGSGLFCDVLRNTDNFGLPKEWMSIRKMIVYSKTFNINKFHLPTYINFILSKTTTSNGIFSLKLHINQYLDLKRKFNFDIFSLNFDYVYNLKRRDKLAQALSLAKSSISDVWSQEDKPLKPLPKEIPRTIVLSKLVFLSRMDDFYDRQLKNFVKNEFFYEDFMNLDETDIYREILEDCGIDKIPEKWVCNKKKSTNKTLNELDAIMEYIGTNI